MSVQLRKEKGLPTGQKVPRWGHSAHLCPLLGREALLPLGSLKSMHSKRPRTEVSNFERVPEIPIWPTPLETIGEAKDTGGNGREKRKRCKWRGAGGGGVLEITKGLIKGGSLYGSAACLPQDRLT